MDNFIVSARKYRPETFTSVVGQGSITSTLKSSIISNRLGHAYLFCGPRGVGKTTCARIFAKAINCNNPGQDAEPCNKCESCLSFNEGRSYNIHELDAASNNSVEDIRLLTEKVRVPPQIGKYSVYIIDEVHMLSSQAFNAFLKTLEEPPSHAVFILATTEKHKIIPTILSRCQIFDFNRIRIDDAVKYLEYIAKAENISYETEALHIIAQKADGAMRDALSIFDQVVSFSGKQIVYQTVIENLNILDYEYYFKVTDFLLGGDVSNSLLSIDEVIRKGFDGHDFINGLANHLRELLVAKNKETINLLEVSENFKKLYVAQSEKCPLEFLFSGIEICTQTDNQYKTSRNQRLLVELALIKMAGLTGLKKKSLNQEDNNILSAVLPEQTNDLIPKQPVIKSQLAEPVLLKKEKTEGHINIVDETPAEEINERHARKNVVPRHNISIRDAISGKPEATADAEKITDIDPEISPDEEISPENLQPFDQDMLTEKWKEFAESIKAEKPRMAIALKSKLPLLKPGYLIEVILENSTQQEDFISTIKAHLQAFLQKELQNDTLKLVISLSDQSDESRTKLYTTEEKFQYMAGKNPSLAKLKSQFNMEFE